MFNRTWMILGSRIAPNIAEQVPKHLVVYPPDWNGETTIGANHRPVIASLVECISCDAILDKVEHKTAAAVGRALIYLFKPFKARVHSLTTDNSKDRASHRALARQLDSAFDFVHAYAAWEGGTNENTNGLVRYYLFPSRVAL